MIQKKHKNEDILNVIEAQIEELRERLGKLYNSLETGKIEIDYLAPRIKELKTQIDKLEAKRNEVIIEIKNPKTLPFNLQTLNDYAKDLADLLQNGSIMEQKAILKSFVKRIIVNRPDIKLDYTLPLVNQNNIGRTTETEVLPMLQIGSPARTRTSDTLVNSQMLYRLSYRGTMIL